MIARMHQALVWDRTRHLQRLRQALREHFPAALGRPRRREARPC
jgi:hypothetical protein